MWPILLAFLGFVVIFTLVTYFMTRWVSKYVQESISGRLDAIDAIVNEERVPSAWLRRLRARARRLKRSGATEERIARLTARAQQRALARIAELIRYVENVGLTDSEHTKRLLLKELREQERRWQDEETWNEMVDLTAPEDEETGEGSEER
ncbi:MAG: hypothetical protein ACP5HG_12450 [Anaerolineae bacterium]